MKKVLFLFAAVLPIITGCDVKELYPGSKVGQTISFSANTAYSNGPTTRTEYSGQFYGDSPTYERINWVINDTIRIYSDVASEPGTGNYYSDYVVSAVGNNDDVVSTATIAPPEGSRGLAWGEGVHNFYGIYPSPTINANVSYTAPNQLSLTIPATQSYTLDGLKLKPDMDYAYMYAVAQTEAQESVSLEFKPLFTAFEFNVDSGNEDSMTLSYFTLTADAESPFLTGNYTATISDTGGYSITVDSESASRSISLSFGEEGITVTKGSPINFTVFALPQDLTGLTVKFGFTNGKSRELELKKKPEGSEEYQFVTFLGGKKYRITNMNVPSGDDWTYTLEEIDDIILSGDGLVEGDTQIITITSFAEKDTETRGVSWKAYVLSDTGSWVSQDEEGWPSWLTMSSTSGEGSSAGENRDIVIAANPLSQSTVTDNSGVNMTGTLRGRTEVGSESSPRDLSLYDIYGNLFVTGENAVSSITQAGSHTSNCYIVSAPGYYCFPLVYGNSIDATRGTSEGEFGGKVYTNAYMSQNASKGAYYNSDGQGIGSPYILSDPNLSKTGHYNAIVVWQDVLPGHEIIKTGKCEIIDAPSGAGLSCKYIRFYIAQEDILPGNILIALRDDNKILWSWHIWVTDVQSASDADDFKIINLLYRTDNSTDLPTTSVDVLNCNLGWTPQLIYSEQTTIGRSATIRIVPDYGSASPVTFNVIQPATTVTHPAGYYYSNTFYQWGRKDPFLPSNGKDNGTRNKEYSNAESNYVIIASNNIANYSTDLNYVDLVSHPYIMRWADGVSRYDLWNSNNSTNSSSSYNTDNLIVAKTVNDPCPAGFSVPLGRFLTGCTTDGTDAGMYDSAKWCGTGASRGMKGPGRRISNIATREESPYPSYIVFFPYTGERALPNLYVTSSTHLWTATPVSGSVGLHVAFSSQLLGPYRNINKGYQNGKSVRPALEQ